MSNLHHRWCTYCKVMRVHDSGVCTVCKNNPDNVPRDMPKPEPEPDSSWIDSKKGK